MSITPLKHTQKGKQSKREVNWERQRRRTEASLTALTTLQDNRNNNG